MLTCQLKENVGKGPGVYIVLRLFFLIGFCFLYEQDKYIAMQIISKYKNKMFFYF